MNWENLSSKYAPIPIIINIFLYLILASVPASCSAAILATTADWLVGSLLRFGLWRLAACRLRLCAAILVFIDDILNPFPRLHESRFQTLPLYPRAPRFPEFTRCRVHLRFARRIPLEDRNNTAVSRGTNCVLLFTSKMKEVKNIYSLPIRTQY